MIYPDYENFKKIKEKYEKITIYKEVFADTFTPISFLMNYATEDYIFLLESVNIDKTFSRFSFFGIKPAKIIYGVKDKTYVVKDNQKKEIDLNIVDYLQINYKKQPQFSSGEYGDFAGGLVGFFGYESMNFMNFLRKNVKMDSSIHSAFFEVNDFFVFDNFKNKLYLAKCINNNDIEYFEAVENLKKFQIKINENANEYKSFEKIDFLPEYKKYEFIDRVKAIKNEIINGEAIQIVFSQKFSIDANINPISFYRGLRKINPSPYMFFLKFKQNIITGSSPETHLKVKDSFALLKPIAGTYPVERDIDKVKKRLLNDEKEMAEHLMLLDLARNDLYQGCNIDSVKVNKSFVTEVYSHVVHIVSEVTGKLAGNFSSFDLFLKTFPAGTVSGAPKVRAIELINEYENSVRGFYAGCVGYFGYNHDLDTCITIRSAHFSENSVVVRAGAGIVYDSIPENEFTEVNRKLKALFKAFEIIKEIEYTNVFVS